MSFRKTFAPTLLAALSTAAAAHPGSAEESRIRIETESTEARIEFCTTKEDCNSSTFLASSPKEPLTKRPANNVPKNQSKNLIKQINDHIFGLLGF